MDVSKSKKMKIAVLSDAHGNQIYFEQVLKKINEHKVDKIFYLGDAFGYGKHSKIILEQLIKLNVHCLLGNHEAMLLGYLPINAEKEKIYHLEDERSNLSIQELEHLKSLLPFYELTVENKKILFVHGSPFNPLQGYIYEDTVMGLDKLPYDIIFMGHTHRPFIKNYDDLLVINVGSCGLPRDIGNMPSFVVFDSSDLACEIVRVEINETDIGYASIGVHDEVKKCFLRNNK